MAIKYGNWVWEGVSTEPKPVSPVALDGHVFKELDTGESYTMVDGNWEFINLGLSFIKATKSGVITTDINGIASIIFVTPFINDEITIQLTCESVSQLPGVEDPLVYYTNVSSTGFGIKTIGRKTGKKAPNINVAWLATRDYNP